MREAAAEPEWFVAAGCAEGGELEWFALRRLPVGRSGCACNPANGSLVVTEWVTL